MAVVITLLLLGLVYWIGKQFSRKNPLEDLGIAHEKPLALVGSFLKLLLQKEGMINFFERIYKMFPNEKIFGFYGLFGYYGIGIKDPALIKQIMIKHFDCFVNNEPILKGDKLLDRSLILLRDQNWRNMRTMLSPIYTSSKMKYMFGLLTDSSNDFIKFHEESAKLNSGAIEIETHDFYARATADGISTTALGFKGDCVRNNESEIYKIAHDMEVDFTQPVKGLFRKFFPMIYKLLGKQIFRKSVHDFFEVNVLNEFKRRQKGNFHRPDVIQHLVQAKDGQMKLETEHSSTETKIKQISSWTDQDLIAQAFVFFFAGFETTATLMQAISFELAQNQEVQQILIDEVDETLNEVEGKTISYERLNQMKFLEMVVDEALRKWPSFRITARKCSKDCTLKDETTGRTYKILQGVDITVPIGAIQMDPKFFPNPDKFDPYRFSQQNKSNIQSGSYLPFGLGPRMCIGNRYALLEAKLLLFSVISKFRIEKTRRTPSKLTFSKGSTGFNERIYVKLSMRK